MMTNDPQAIEKYQALENKLAIARYAIALLKEQLDRLQKYIEVLEHGQ